MGVDEMSHALERGQIPGIPQGCHCFLRIVRIVLLRSRTVRADDLDMGLRVLFSE